ncbi:unnamed protein product [Schistosoma turkestanicum]|nr:unnamed protein product [Schistosoma turkestanicum]
MSSCICALRCIVCLVNIIIGFIAGIVTVIGGIYIWGEKSLHNSLHTFILDGISSLKDKKEITKLLFKLFDEIQPFGVYIFIVGLIVFIICLFGVIGTCFKCRQVIYLYLILHLLVLVPEIVIVVVYLCRPDIVTTFGRDLFNSSIQHYVSYDSPNIHSHALNQIMIQLQCCGLNNGSDFAPAKFTRQNIVFNGERWYEFKYPVSCCKKSKSQELITDNGCPGQFTLENSNIHIGCWTKIKSYIMLYGNLTAYTLCGIVGLQILLILFVLTSIRTKRKIKPV